MWKICCALHNISLQNDGLDKDWDGADVIDESGVNAITKLKKMTTVNCSRTTTKNIDHYPHNHFKNTKLMGSI